MGFLELISHFVSFFLFDRFPVIASPSSYWYLNDLSLNWTWTHDYEPTYGLNEDESNLIIGGEGTLWAGEIFF